MPKKPSENFQTLADAIKWIRWHERLSQQEFAQELGCSQITISGWERGARLPTYKGYRALLKFLENHKIEIELPDK